MSASAVRHLHRWHAVPRAACVAAVAAALAPTALPAQATAPSPRLVLGRVYQEAREASPRIEAARALARAVAKRTSAARLPPDPQLQLGFMNYTLPGLEPMDPLGMTQLQLMQMVPTAGKLRLSGRVAEAQASAAGERAVATEWEVRSQAAMAFYELYTTAYSLGIARETLRLLQDVLRTAETMYRVGEGQQADVLRAHVEIARMTEDTLRMQAMRTSVAAQLNAILNRNVDATVAPPVLPAFPDSSPSLDWLVTLAEASRPMVRGSEADVRAAEAAARLVRREIWPDVQLGVAYGQRQGELGTERMGSLMIGASLPVFARGRQLRMRQEAAAMHRMAVADLAAMRADTRGRVATAHADLTRARRLTVLYWRTVIPQAEATAASALAAYRVGGVDFMTLLEDRMTVNRYRQELAALQADEGKAWAELEMLIGRELLDAFSTAHDMATATPSGGAR